MDKPQLEEFFESNVPGCQPVVGPVVPHEGHRLSSTVTIRADSRGHLLEAITQLNGKSYKDKDLQVSHISVDDEFHGLRPVYESTNRSPMFEYAPTHTHFLFSLTELHKRVFRSWPGRTCFQHVV